MLTKNITYSLCYYKKRSLPIKHGKVEKLAVAFQSKSSRVIERLNACHSNVGYSESRLPGLTQARTGSCIDSAKTRSLCSARRPCSIPAANKVIPATKLCRSESYFLKFFFYRILKSRERRHCLLRVTSADVDNKLSVFFFCKGGSLRL